jgi:hypothetical protein
MLVESEGYSKSVQSKLATIIAIAEVGGIVKGSARYIEWRSYTKQHASDLIAQYDLYCALPDIYEGLYEEMGIITKNVEKAAEVNERLCSELNLEVGTLEPILEDELEPLLKSIIAGQLHELWVVQAGGDAVHYASGNVRELSGNTVVRNAALVVGTPFDLEIPTSKGMNTLHLLNDLTVVQPEWLEGLAPGVFKSRPGKIYYDSRFGALAQRSEVKFGKKSFETSGVPIFARTKEIHKLFVTIYAQWIRTQLDREHHALHASVARHIQPVSVKKIERQLEYLLDGAVSLHELSKKDRIAVGRLSKLDNYYGEIMANSKHVHGHNDHAKDRHHSNNSSHKSPNQKSKKKQIWKPPHMRGRHHSS